MKTVTFNNDRYTIPSKWNELSTKQLVAVAKIMLSESEWDIIKVRLILYFLGMRVIRHKTVVVDGIENFYIKHGFRRVYLISAYDIDMLGNTLNFLTEKPDKEGKRLLRPTVKKQPFPVLKLRFRKYIGYKNALTDMLFGEFIFAETYYYRYLKTKDEAWLNRLLAVLYRRVKNGKRQEFSEENIEQNAAIIAKLPPYVKLAMRFFYDGSKEQLAEEFPSILGSGGSASGKAKDPFKDFHKITIAMASANPTDAEDVRSSLLYDALESFEQTTKAQERIDNLMKH